MAQTTCSSSSSSSPSIRRMKHDVFLSFRGEDTRNNFTGHLHTALQQKGIKTFIDNKQLIKGEEISPSLISAIEGSKISIIVFSENYASSTWCLDELVKIMECRKSLGQLVWPIFFHVEPSQVRNQTGSFGEAFDNCISKYKEKLNDQTGSSTTCGEASALCEANSIEKCYNQKLANWKISLNKAGSLCGWHLSNSDESQLIQRILEATLSKLNRTLLHVAKYPIGIEHRLKDLAKLIKINTANDVRVVGIYGIGGIGKTTIAKAAFNKFADDFEGASFLANVRETSKQYSGLIQLQETLLFDILGDPNIKVGNTHRGINIIKERLCHKRILLVLDDVDQFDQLETLAGGVHDWFGPRSRIIITTRNKHFLTSHGVDETYEVEGLDFYEAIALLSWNAFKGHKPVEGYHELSKCVVGYANGLPLALVVSGSFLCGRKKSEWESAINNLEKKPQKQVYDILKISYDALQDDEKAIFLDIACFFVGEKKDYIIKILGTYNFCPTIGIGVLIDMSLITIEWGKVSMHHVIQEVGREIVRQESPEVGRRSRLWLTEDVSHVFLENMGTNAIEGIKLDLPEPKTLYSSAKAFKKMKRLRMLILHKVVLSTAISYLPSELRFIDWPGYQFPTLPLNPGPKQLVILNMPQSHIQQLGEAFKNFENLKVVKLSSSKFLTKIPDLSTAPNLESLYLDHCTNLVEIHESIGSLSRLETLNLQFCCNLMILPTSLHSKCLRTLNLTGCSSLKSFPNIVVEMENLKTLGLSSTAVEKLPDISKAPNLEHVYLDHCTNLVEIHESVGSLNKLVTLNLQFCCNLKILPSNFHLEYLATLNLRDCSSLERFPNILVEMKFLKELCLIGSAINELPSSIENLVALGDLNLTSCRKLEHIPSSIYRLHHLNHLSLGGCSKLSKFPKNISKICPSMEFILNTSISNPFGSFPMLNFLDLQNCNLLEAGFLMTDPNGFCNLEVLNLAKNKFVSLPSTNRFSKLRYLYLNDCEFLQNIPELPGNLTLLDASGCKSLLEPCGYIMTEIVRNKATLNGCECQFVLPGHQIPHWFSHECDQDSIDFTLDSYQCEEKEGVVICAVFELDCEQVILSLDLLVNNVACRSCKYSFVYQKHYIHEVRSIISVKPGHLCLHYFPGPLRCGNYKVSFSAKEKPSAKFISKCGVHILGQRSYRPIPKTKRRYNHMICT